MCLLMITHEGYTTEFSLIQMGSSDQTVQEYLGYHFLFNLTPYPSVGKNISAGDYRLVLKVTLKV